MGGGRCFRGKGHQNIISDGDGQGFNSLGVGRGSCFNFRFQTNDTRNISNTFSVIKIPGVASGQLAGSADPLHHMRIFNPSVPREPFSMLGRYSADELAHAVATEFSPQNFLSELQLKVSCSLTKLIFVQRVFGSRFDLYQVKLCVL